MPVKARPFLHQMQEFDFTCEKFGFTAPYLSNNGVALLIKMSTGKTVASIGIIGALNQFGKVNRVWGVCPLSNVAYGSRNLRTLQIIHII